MRYETITFVYNEEFLLPFYLNHYRFVDRFNFIYDVDSTDNTLDIIQSLTNANIVFFKFPDMMDDEIKANEINRVYAGLSDCWVLNVDADEFAFIDSIPVSPVNCVSLHHVFRHRTDSDLDPGKPIKSQRAHGFLEPMYTKPILVRSGLSIKWQVGNHRIIGMSNPPAAYDGAHWANADRCFYLKRRVRDRKQRQSKNNLAKKLTYQHHNITEADVLKYCKEHENDPRCW
ncbi:MAG: glycosyltransferase family 2 protein [Anaerohalosphaeraceae bacterium]